MIKIKSRENGDTMNDKFAFISLHEENIIINHANGKYF